MAKKVKEPEIVYSEKIVTSTLEEVLHNSMIPYAEHVILDRALPRVEDGLKPVQRRILYSMFEQGFTPDKGYKKLVQMNIKYDDNEEERYYFNYDENGTLTSLDLEYYEDGFFDGEETYYIKWDNNIISYSKDGVEWEDIYQISDGKAVKDLWEKFEFEYDSNDC